MKRHPFQQLYAGPGLLHSALLVLLLSWGSSARPSEADQPKFSPDSIAVGLRQDAPKADVATQAVAVQLYQQGWTFTMPVPKSKQAAWGNTDGRTTWWYGYWTNSKTNKSSDTDPIKDANGNYAGDDQVRKGFYRRGGSPPDPTEIEWLLSSGGGPQHIDKHE